MALRWFTPTVEVSLCGHATLAAAHVLFEHYLPARRDLTFRTLSGNLLVARGADGMLTLDFPSQPGQPIGITDGIVEALGQWPRQLLRSRDVVAVFDRESDVRDFKPDFARIAAIADFALVITAPGAEVDFVSRVFGPSVGIPEDPVTGSSHCTLIPYWSGRLGKTMMTARQLSARGGELHCTLRGDRVGIGGRAVEYMRGEISVSDLRIRSGGCV